MNIEHKPTLRIIEILNLISSEHQGCRLSEVSARLGIPMGTLSPIVHTLRENKYLSYDEQAQTYSLGIRLFEIGSRYMQYSNAFENMTVIMQEIVQRCGETVHLAVLDGQNVLDVAKVDSTEPIRMYSAIGKRLPAYSTAVGKALMAGYTEEELRALYPEGLKPITPHTITDFGELARQLRQVQETQMAYEKEESNEMIRCTAKPILKNGTAVAAMSVTIPLFRWTEEKQEFIEQLLNEYAVYAGQIAAHMNL